jgi:hypothetical protein
MLTDAPLDRVTIRKIFLYVISAVYFGEAVLALWDPQSVYLGMWSVLGVVSFIAARRAHEPLLGDVVACLIVGEAVARVLSVALDGAPGSISFVHIAMETAPIAVLLIRPPALQRADAVA